MDTGHVFRAGEDVEIGLRLLTGRVFAVHLKDVNANGQDVPLGEGILNIKKIVESLDSFCVCSIEWEGEDPEGLKKGVDYLRRIGVV